MGWKDMSCMERFAKILMILTFALLFVTLVLNCYVIYKASTDTWFTKCSDCKTETNPRGTKDCEECCQDCTKKDEIFFYIMRAYNMIFLIVSMVAELKPAVFMDFAKVCAFYFPRGFWHIFLGFMTVTISLADPTSAVYADILGYILMFFGCVHFCMGLCCYNEYDGEARQKEYEIRYGGGGQQQGGDARPQGGGDAPRGGGDSRNGQYDYKYNGQSYTYNSNNGGGGPNQI